MHDNQNSQQPPAILGQQLALIRQPARQQLDIAEWRIMQRQGMERRHQRFSRSSRAEMQAFYKGVFQNDPTRSANDGDSQHQK